MKDETRYLNLPNVERAGEMTLISVSLIKSISEPDSTIVTYVTTGEVADIDPSKYCEIFMNFNDISYIVPLSVKEMIQLINSDARYYS